MSKKLCIILSFILILGQHVIKAQKNYNQADPIKMGYFPSKAKHYSFIDGKLKDEPYIVEEFSYKDEGSIVIRTKSHTVSSSKTRITTYNPNKNYSETVKKYFLPESKQWVNQYKWIYRYDDTGYNFERTSYEWVNDEWKMTFGFRNIQDYNVDGSVHSYIWYSWEEDKGWIETRGYKNEKNFKNDLLISKIRYTRRDRKWIPIYKMEYYYDNNNRLSYSLDYNYDNDKLNISYREEYSGWFIWDKSNIDNSHPYTKIGYSYKGDGDINDLNNYNIDYKEIFTYPNGKKENIPLLTVLNSYDWKDKEWQLDYRITFEKDENYESVLEEELSSEGEWLPYLYTEEYISESLEYNIDKRYSNGELRSAKKSTTEFDRFKNRTVSKSEIGYTENNWNIHNASIYETTYDDYSSRILQIVYKNWSSQSEEYINSNKIVYEYDSTNIPRLSSEIKVYPTLFKNILHIQSPKEGRATFYDLAGNAIKVIQLFTGKNTFLLSELQPGFYIVKIDGDSYKVKKQSM